MTIYQTIEPIDPLPIIDGKVTYENHDIGFKLILKVKQVKGRGVADADNLKELNPYHSEMLKVLKNVDDGAEFTGLQLRQWIASARIHNGDMREFKDNNWMRPISELYRKGIFSARREGRTWKYKWNKHLGMMALENGVFP